MDSPHKGPVTREMFPFDDAYMIMAIIMTHDPCNEFQNKDIRVIRVPI